MDGKSLLNMSLLEFITKYCTWVGSVNNRSKTGGFETLLPKCPLKGEGKGGGGGGVGVKGGVGGGVGVKGGRGGVGGRGGGGVGWGH